MYVRNHEPRMSYVVGRNKGTKLTFERIRKRATRPTLVGITGAARRLFASLFLLLVVEAVVVLCLAARLHVGHRTAGGASRTWLFMPKLPHFFAICMWVYMRLDNFKRSEFLHVDISQISLL